MSSVKDMEKLVESLPIGSMYVSYYEVAVKTNMNEWTTNGGSGMVVLDIDIAWVAHVLNGDSSPWTIL